MSGVPSTLPSPTTVTWRGAAVPGHRGRSRRSASQPDDCDDGQRRGGEHEQSGRRLRRRSASAVAPYRRQLRSSAPRNSSSAALTSAGRSCCSQCPPRRSSTSRYGPDTTSRTRSRGVIASAGSAVPPMNSVGTAIVGDGVVSVSSQFLSKLRYQFSGPVNPVAGELGDVVVDLVLQ